MRNTKRQKKKKKQKQYTQKLSEAIGNLRTEDREYTNVQIGNVCKRLVTIQAELNTKINEVDAKEPVGGEGGGGRKYHEEGLMRAKDMVPKEWTGELEGWRNFKDCLLYTSPSPRDS